MRYVPFNFGDYEQATGHLSACEDGIYMRLLRRYYSTEQPLPENVASIQRFVRARTREEREAVTTVLREFFHKSPDGWRHRRCDYEISRFRERADKARRSANARWAQSERTANAYEMESENGRGEQCERHARGMRLQAGCSPNQEPETKIQEKGKSSSSSVDSSTASDPASSDRVIQQRRRPEISFREEPDQRQQQQSRERNGLIAAADAAASVAASMQRGDR